MDNLHRLEEIFAKFPGIGPRQAKRFVYYLLNKSTSSIKEFVELVHDVKRSTLECPMCHRLYIQGSNQVRTQTNLLSSSLKLQTSSSKLPVCPICSDTSRDQSTLMIVARDSDFETIEKSGAYRGLYFILGGTIPILDKEPDKRIRLESLLKRVSAKSEFKEIILSLNTTPEGEHTGNIVKEAVERVLVPKERHPEIPDVSLPEQPTITVLGRGLSTGAELEYADSETIKNALKNRG